MSESGRISWVLESIISAGQDARWFGYVVDDGVQTAACGSFALDVPRRNLRSRSFVSGEKVYSRDSD